MIIFLTLLLFSISLQPALAANLTVTCPDDPSPSPTNLECSLSSNDPLFNHQNIMPGFVTTPPKVISVDNQDQNNPCFLKVSTVLASEDNLLTSGEYGLELEIADDFQVFYKGPIILSNQSLGQIDINSSRDYAWTVSFPQSAGNDYQNLSTVFDINLNFTCADSADWLPPVVNPATDVFLSEYMPKGSEWVEIFNNNDYAVILDGWQIDDDPNGGMTAKDIPYVTIQAKSFYVLEINGGFLNDGGDHVVLINNQGTAIESTQYDTASDVYSWSKQSDGGWCLAVPTKNDSNNFCYDQPTPADTTDGAVAGVSSTTTTSTSSAGAPQCSDPIPGTPSNLIATDIGGGQVRLNWTHADPPYTSYLIAYGPNQDTFLYGNPNIGTDNNYTVSGLTPGAQYCFYVRAQNGCMPGQRSNVACINPGSAVAIVETTPPAGFEPDILGETTDNDTNDTTMAEIIDLPDIMGASDTLCTHYYAPLLYILALLINSLYFNKNPKNSIVLPGLVSLTAGLIDWFITGKTCCLLPSAFCRFFYIGNIVSLSLPYFFFQNQKKAR